MNHDTNRVLLRMLITRYRLHFLPSSPCVKKSETKHYSLLCILLVANMSLILMYLELKCIHIHAY
jgi:hypothetical protein